VFDVSVQETPKTNLKTNDSNSSRYAGEKGDYSPTIMALCRTGFTRMCRLTVKNRLLSANQGILQQRYFQLEWSSWIRESRLAILDCVRSAGRFGAVS
jgi:hypothetical protein